MGAAQVAGEAVSGPLVLDDAVEFRFPDEDRTLADVFLIQEVQRPRVGPAFRYDEDDRVWRLRFQRPLADRIEYMLQLRHDDGGEESIPDPTNPLRAPGPFGDKSVVEWPSYARPSWLGTEVPAGRIRSGEIRSRTLRGRLPFLVWDPPGADESEPLPMLVAHDGPEYESFSALSRFLEVTLNAGRIPRLRAAMVAPVDRNEIYSASAAYARAFAYEILPALEAEAPTPHGRSQRIGMGASLGALAMLHIHRTHPATFGALYLQSGSYFRQRFDKQERGFPRFGRIARFMGSVLTAEMWMHPVRATITCGTIEENLANNRATCGALERQGYAVNMVENLDGHNWVGWRDTFDPHLTTLLAEQFA